MFFNINTWLVVVVVVVVVIIIIVIVIVIIIIFIVIYRGWACFPVSENLKMYFLFHYVIFSCKYIMNLY